MIMLFFLYSGVMLASLDEVPAFTVDSTILFANIIFSIFG